MKQIATYKYIKEYLATHGYACELISTEYVNRDSKLAFRCECGNILGKLLSNCNPVYTKGVV